MILTKKNLHNWKTLLSIKMKERYGVEDFASCKTDKEWLEDCEGASEEEAISEEVQYWD